MNEAPKYIVIDGELIFGNVEYHSELIQNSHREKGIKPSGGGRFYWNQGEVTLIIYGSSHDFKSVTKDQFIAAWKDSLISPYWENVTVLFSAQERISNAKEDNEDITALLKS